MGANGYVSKPIEPVELFGAIGLCCGTDLDPMLSEAPLDAIPRPDVTLEVAEEAANLMGSLDDLMDGTD